ncbi:MAG: hypothetical protein ABR878_14780, partial [Roseiarcus sp.]
GTTRQPLETSWGNQPQGQDFLRLPSPEAITRAYWSEGDTLYLAFSTRLDPDVMEYPDSNKFNVASMIPPGGGMLSAKFSYLGRKDHPIDYFDGEE